MSEVAGIALSVALFIVVPLVIVAEFIYDLVRFVKADKEKRRELKGRFVTVSVVFGIFVMIVTALMILMGLAVANM